MTSRKMRTLPNEIRDELNFARTGLICLQERIPEAYSFWERTEDLPGGQAKLQIRCENHNSLVPHGVDNDVAMGLYVLHHSGAAQTDGYLHFTGYQLLLASGIYPNGRAYRELMESLYRLYNTNYRFTSGWRDHRRKVFGVVNFRFVTSMSYGDERPLMISGEADLPLLRDVMDVHTGTYFRVRLADEITDSLNAGYIKPLDLLFLRSLKKRSARSLYRLLDARRYDPVNPVRPVMTLEMDLRDWAATCGMASSRIDNIITTLGRAHSELIERGYLQSVEISGQRKQQVIKYRFAAISVIPDPLLMTSLTGYGVTRTMALQLISDHGDERVAQQLARFEQMINAGTSMRNRAGMLVDVIRDQQQKYGPAISVPVLSAPVSGAVTVSVSSSRLPRELPSIPERQEENEAGFRALPIEDQIKSVLTVMKGAYNKRFPAELQAQVRAALLSGRIDPYALKRSTAQGLLTLSLEDALQTLREQVNAS